jgi:hypothetical protein
MKTIKIIPFLLLMVVSGGRLLAQAEATQQMVVPLSEPGKPFTFEAKIMYGYIKVVGYEGKEVVIDIRTDTFNVRGGTDNNGMKKIGSTGGGLDFAAEEKDNTVRINAGLSRKLLGITVKVPQTGGKLRLGTIEHGYVTVNNVSAEIEVNNVSGDITLTRISGSVVASTVNGSLTVDFKTVDPKAPMAFSALSGKIDVTFPADTRANLKVKSDNGEIFTDFDLAVDKTEPKVDKTNEGHIQRISIEDWVLGKINGGGPEMMMKTMQGNIYVRKAK